MYQLRLWMDSLRKIGHWIANLNFFWFLKLWTNYVYGSGNWVFSGLNLRMWQNPLKKHVSTVFVFKFCSIFLWFVNTCEMSPELNWKFHIWNWASDWRNHWWWCVLLRHCEASTPGGTAPHSRWKTLQKLPTWMSSYGRYCCGSCGCCCCCSHCNCPGPSKPSGFCQSIRVV